MKSERKEAQKYFNKVPGQWDALYSHENRLKYAINKWLRKGLFRRYKLTFEYCSDLTGARVLDIGCGTGRYSIECAKRGAGRIVGIDFAPSMIKCFPNSLKTFAEFIKKKGIAIPPVRSISCTGENLYAHQRKLFEETFGGEVFEKVGTRESGVFACECKAHKGMHVFTEGVFLEILNGEGQPAQPGEIGKVIITDLFNKAMPLIRYDIGDMAAASDGRICDCGNPLPLIEKLLGRDRDIILDSYGDPKPGYLFTEVVLNKNLSAQFQIVQPDKKSLVVKIKNGGAVGVDLPKLRAEFQEIVGPLVKVDFNFVTEIPRDPSGKYRYVLSKVEH